MLLCVVTRSVTLTAGLKPEYSFVDVGSHVSFAFPFTVAKLFHNQAIRIDPCGRPSYTFTQFHTITTMKLQDRSCVCHCERTRILEEGRRGLI